MACDPTTKKAKKRAREHAAAAAKVFKNHDPLCGKTWAVTEEERQAAIDRGSAWGNENGAIRVAHAPDAQANPVVLEGGWGIGGLVIPKTEPTQWPDGISTKYEEGKIPEWIDTTPPKTEAELLKERVDKALVGWPWKGTPSELVSTAPYTFNENVRFTLPEATQSSFLFVKLFSNDVVLEKVCHLLFQHHDAAWKFSATCKEAWRIMQWNIDTWDMTEGYFHNCERPRTGEAAPKDPFDQGSVAPIVMVTPVRRETGPATYFEQMRNLHKLCVSINNFADYFQNLQLHRVPFLTTDLLSLLIPKMRNLKILGIYKCQLIHVGETMKLLDIIKTDRPLERENQVSLDFYPNFHLGPVEEPGNPYSVGAYGVTWDNWNFDTTRAVWCLVIQIIPKARSQGIDFESKHSMFRQWMEHGPCHEIEETIAAFMIPQAHDEDESKEKAMNIETLKKVAAMVNYRRTGGKIEKLKQVNRLGGGSLGKNKQKPKKPGEVEIDPALWAITSHKCTTCKEKLMGIFFSYTHIMERQTGLSPHISCVGCLLNGVLRKEADHFKQEKRDIMRSWLVGPDGLNKDDLGKALADYHNRQVLLQAKQLADQHVTDSTTGSDPYDKELNERQKPITMKERSGKTTALQRSPEIYNQAPGTGYDYIRVERYDGHGLGN